MKTFFSIRFFRSLPKIIELLLNSGPLTFTDSHEFSTDLHTEVMHEL